MANIISRFTKKRYGVLSSNPVFSKQEKPLEGIPNYFTRGSLDLNMVNFFDVMGRYILDRFGKEEYNKWQGLNYHKLKPIPNVRKNVFTYCNLFPVLGTIDGDKFYAYIEEKQNSPAKYSLFDGTCLVEANSSINSEENTSIMLGSKKINFDFWNEAHSYLNQFIQVKQIQEEKDIKGDLEFLCKVNLVRPSEEQVASLPGYQYKFALEKFSHSDEDLIRFFAFLRGGSMIFTPKPSSSDVISAIICR